MTGMAELELEDGSDQVPPNVTLQTSFTQEALTHHFCPRRRAQPHSDSLSEGSAPGLSLANFYDIIVWGLPRCLGPWWDPTPTLWGDDEGLRLVPCSSAGSTQHLGAGLGEPVVSSGLMIPSINDKPAHFQAFMINSWPYLMSLLPTFLALREDGTS